MSQGVFLYPDRARQLIDLTTLGKDGRYPTDIDGFFEDYDRLRIIYEFKQGDAVCPLGQRLAMSRLVDDFERIGKHSCAIIAEHYTDSKEIVKASECIVREVYINHKWWKPNGKITVGWYTEEFRKRNKGWQR